MKTIEVENIGPVKAVKIECPEEGGVVVLRGRNGRGKSKTLEAVEAAMTGRGKPAVRDGAQRGKVEAFGAKLTVGKRVSHAGELEVLSLEGKLDLAALVDPGLKTPEAADARRIKALVQLTGVPADINLFDTAGIAPPNLGDDLVEMASAVKRRLEEEARRIESEADKWTGKEAAHRASGEGATESAPDEQALAAALEQAVREEAAITAQSKAAIEAGYAVAAAKKKLAEAEATYKGPSVDEALRREAELDAACGTADDLVQALERKLQAAREDLAKADADRAAAIAARQSAEYHACTIASWRAQIEADRPAMVSLDAIETAARAVSEARQALEDGAVNRVKLGHLRSADKARDAKLQALQEAERLRKAAADTDRVLSDAVAQTGSPLRVEQGRLVLDTHRGATMFSELSAGERWRIVIDVAIDAVGSEGVFVIPQEAFEGLDNIARREIADHVRERGVIVLTAECSDDEELRSEIFSAN